MDTSKKKTNRRDFLFTATYTIGVVGVGATIWPLVHQMNPDKAQQALATTEVDISQVEPGKSITVLWRGKPVFLKRRTQEEIAEARSVLISELPDPQKDEERVKDGKDEWLVIVFSLIFVAHFVGPLQEYMLRGWEILELASDYFWIIILTIVGGSFGSSGITKFLKKK